MNIARRSLCSRSLPLGSIGDSRTLLRTFLHLMVVVVVMLPVTARGASAEDKAKAREYFDAGAQAIAAGQYLFAAQAFVKANKFYPNPEIEFSAAQAYRLQFFTNPSNLYLRPALKLYRSYLRQVSHGGRRFDATKGLAELAPYERQLSETNQGQQEQQGPRILVTSPIKGAVVSIDRRAPVAAPLAALVPEGQHRLVISAPGYYDEKTTIIAVKGDLVAENYRLRPKPAALRIAGAEGAELFVDGKLETSLPHTGPIEVSEGAHFVAVGKTGYKPFAQHFELSRGSATSIDLQLPATNQRRASYAVLAATGAMAVASGILLGLSIKAQADAQDLEELRTSANLTAEQRDEYNTSVAKRDDLAVAAGVTSGITGALLITGLGLFLFDDPELNQPTVKVGGSAAVAQASVLVGPGVLGLKVYGRF